MFVYLVAGLFAVLLYLIKTYLDGFKKWSHLPGVKPHWFFGNKPMFTKNMKDCYLDHYNSLEGQRFGLFWNLNEPCIFLRDLELIKRVQVTDFDHFTQLGFSKPRKNHINQFGIADMENSEDWKKLKRAVTPSFAAPRLKKNVSTMNECAIKTLGYLRSLETNEFVDPLNFSKKYYLSCIASIGFGLNIDCFGHKETSFEKNAKQVFSMTKFMFVELFPDLADILRVSIITNTFAKYMGKLGKDVVKQRKNQNLQYNDMLNNLIEVSKDHPEMTEEIMYNTCIQFFGDGYESAGLIFCVLVYYLAVYPEVQERLQQEIDDVLDAKKDDGDINQEDINSMTYLEQVLLEAQRLGPVPMTGRTCTKDWKIPGDSFVVPKGTRVIIPIVGLHFDPQYWPDPLTFDPDRFSSENKANIDTATFQTFGFGPRACLGRNLFHIETKLLLVQLLRNFRLKPFGHMPKIMEWDQYAFIGKEKYQVKIERRK